MNPNRPTRGLSATRSSGFTLVELLVVILIIMLVSAATLPVILSGLQQRQISEAGRIFQAALAGARDSAIANNAPRGIRLLPDPVLTQPTPAQASTAAAVGSSTWACNRFIPIEQAADYHEGLVTFFNPTWDSTNSYAAWYLDPAYTTQTPTNYVVNSSGTFSGVLMVMQSFNTGDLTSWAWNLRVGDKIQFDSSSSLGSTQQSTGTGNIYTIVGPMAVQNAEGFINYDPTNGPPTPSGSNYVWPAPEFLLLVNGVDDDGDGFVDNGFNGVSTPLNPYETEKWLGAQVQQAANPSTSILKYVVKRRPIPAKGARETLLPANVVIDLTTWNRSLWDTLDVNLPERSRLPIDGTSRYIDVLLDPSGQVIQSTFYSSPSAFISPFLHFWLTDREGVVAPIIDSTTNAPSAKTALISNAVNPTTNKNIYLPMPQGTANYSSALPLLQGERMLVSISTRTGNVAINSITNFDASTPDASAPFYAAQQGAKESP